MKQYYDSIPAHIRITGRKKKKTSDSGYYPLLRKDADEMTQLFLDGKTYADIAIKFGADLKTVIKTVRDKMLVEDRILKKKGT